MKRLPVIRLSTHNNSRLPVIIHDITEEDLAPLWPLPERTTRFLPSSGLALLSSPRTALQGVPESLQEKLVGGVHVLEDSREYLVGVCYVVRPEYHIPGIGLYLHERALRQGIGTMVVHGLTRHVLDNMGRDIAQASTLAVNEPSKRTLLKSGYTKAPARPEPTIQPYGPDGAYAERENYLVFKDNGRTYGPTDFKVPSPTEEAIAHSRRAFLEQKERFAVEFIPTQ